MGPTCNMYVDVQMKMRQLLGTRVGYNRLCENRRNKNRLYDKMGRNPGCGMWEIWKYFSECNMCCNEIKIL